MSGEIKAKMERMVSIYENRVLVVIVLAALTLCAGLSVCTLKYFSGETFNQAGGDVAVITYEDTYYGRPVTRIVKWIDRDGFTHFAKESPKWAGIEVPVLVSALVNLLLLKAGYDTYSFLTRRYRRRLASAFQYQLRSE